MKSIHPVFVVIMVLLYGCEKDNTSNSYSYKGYPTAYFKIEPSELQQRENDYFDINPFTQTGLNEFGFCGLKESDLDRTIEYPPDPQLTASEAKGVVMDFLSHNSHFTGVKNPDEMNFYNIDSSFNAWDGSRLLSFRSSNQFVNGIEVYYSSIIFHLWHGKMKYCDGNWYPEISIPGSFRVDSTAAKQQLIGRVVTYFGWSGPFHATISKSNIAQSSAKTVILPVKDDNAIVLNVTWEINVPAPAYYKFYIDVMSGKIISEEPTIDF